MFPIFAAIFIVLPIVELAILIKVGTLWGLGNTVLLIILTGFLGASLARSQGLHVLFQIREDLSRGVMPKDKILDGVLILGAGLVLLTPGFVTDAAGFFLLWPGGRRWFKNVVANFFKNRFSNSTTNSTTVDYYVEDE